MTNHADRTTEDMIQAKGLTAPRITPAIIQALLDRVVYVPHHPEGTTSTFVHAYLDGRFMLATGHSACVSLENFDKEIGIKIAKENALKQATQKLWELEGYALYKSQVQA